MCVHVHVHGGAGGGLHICRVGCRCRGLVRKYAPAGYRRVVQRPRLERGPVGRLLESGEQACGWTDAPVRARTRRRFRRVRHHHASWTPPGRAAASSTVTRGPRVRNHGADFCTRSWRGNPNRPMAASLLAFFFLFFSRRDPIQILPDNELKQPRRPKQNKPTAKALLLPLELTRRHVFTPTLSAPAAHGRGGVCDISRPLRRPL